jgi:hypothetical protein
MGHRGKRKGPSLSDNAAILEQAGFVLRGRRATCPYCEGRCRQTVAVTDDGLYFCHRCHNGGHVRSLARQLGYAIPPTRIRKASIRKARFHNWLLAKMQQLGDEERRLARRAEWAQTALGFYPDMEAAWEALAAWHHGRRRFEVFWESASDKIGRLNLYRHWRKYAP